MVELASRRRNMFRMRMKKGKKKRKKREKKEEEEEDVRLKILYTSQVAAPVLSLNTYSRWKVHYNFLKRYSLQRRKDFRS